MSLVHSTFRRLRTICIRARRPLLLGIPTGGSININPSYAEQSTYSEFYVQDDWKVTSKFTLNLGLRYELEGAPTERFNRTVEGFDLCRRLAD